MTNSRSSGRPAISVAVLLFGLLTDRRVASIDKLLVAAAVTYIITPVDLESKYGMTGGHIFHGELALDQLFTMRPLLGWARYRTPIHGLYMCGAGTHPGYGVSGLSGLNAAREILKDL